MKRVKDENQSVVDEVVTPLDGVFDVKLGEYEVTFSTRATGGVEKTVTLKIKENSQPVLTSTPIVKLAKGANIPSYVDLQGEVTLTGDPLLSKDDIVITSLKNNRTIPHGTAPTSQDIDTTTPGVYPIKYYVQNLEGNEAVSYTNYVVEHEVLENKFVIVADNFDIKKVDVDDRSVADLKIQVKEKSNYSGLKLTGDDGKGITPVDAPMSVQNLGTYGKVLGGHKITLQINEEPKPTKEIFANVYEDGDITGKYIIEGKNKTVDFTTAKTNLGKTGSSIINSDFNNVIAWEKNTDVLIPLSEPANYTTPFGFTATGVTPNTYTYTVKVGSGADQVSRPFKVEVTQDGVPRIEVDPTLVSVPLGSDKTLLTTQLMTGVNGYDGASGNSAITPTAKLAIKNGVVDGNNATDLDAIDTSQNGIYKYTYHLTDSQGLPATGERYYVVGEDPTIDEENKLVMFADIYYEGDDEVAYKNNGKAAQAKSGVSVYNLENGQKLTPAIKLDGVEKDYGLDDGYHYDEETHARLTHKIGGYPITFEAQVGTNKIKKSTVANVVNSDVNYTKNYDAIHQVSLELRRSEVTGRKANELTEIYVWDTKTGNDRIVGTDYTVDDTKNFNTTAWETLSYAQEYYKITVKTKAQDTYPGETHQGIIQIKPGGAPKFDLNARVSNDIVNINAEEAKTFDESAAIDITKAWDYEDTNGPSGEYLRTRIKHESGTVGETPGTYIVKYSITDNDHNTTHLTLAYVVDGKATSKHTAIFANSFDVDKKTELEPTQDIEALVKQESKSGVKAEKINRDGNGNITGVEAINLGDIVFDNVDGLDANSSVGGYKVKFIAEDVNTTVVASVIDENVIKGDKVYIFAKDATRRPGEIDKTRDTAEYLTEVKAWNKETGAIETVTNTGLKETTNYKVENVTKPMVHTEFPVKYEATNDPTAIKDVKITITPGDSPVITVDDPVINLDLNATQPTVGDRVSVLDTEDGNTLTVTPLPAQVATNKKGVTVVNYSAIDSDGNPGTNKRSYVVGAKDPQPGDEVAIFANSFAVKKSEFNFGALDAEMNKEIIKLAGPAIAQKISDGSKVDIEVLDAVSFKTGAVGPHDIILKAGSKQVTIVGSIYDNGEVKDGQVIEANNATVRQGDVIGLTSRQVLDSKTPGNVHAWNVEDGTPTNVGVTNESPVYTGLNADSPYTITLTTDEGTSITRTIIVTTVDGPILTNHIPVVKIPVGGDEPDINDIMDGIEIEHVDELLLMQGLTDEKTLELGAKPIKTDEPGVYVVSYQVTDAEGDSSETAYRTYVIGDGVVTNDSVIFADNFKIEKKDVKYVDSDGNQESGLEAELVKKTGAKAYLREPNTTGKGIDEAKPVDVKLSSTTYKKAVGGYPVALKADGKLATKTVTASVIDNEDDGKGDADDEYGVQAYSRVYRPSLAHKKPLANLVDAKAWKVEDASDVTPSITATGTKPDGTVVILNETQWLTEWPHLHKHPDNTVWSVKVVAGDVEVEVELTIDPMDKPVLSFTDNVTTQEVDLNGSAVDMKEFLAVSDVQDTNLQKSDVTVSVPAIDISEKGVTIVHYTVEDSDRNVTTIKRSFIVRDDREDGVGKNEVVFATNYVKHISEYDASDGAIIIDADVKVQKIETGINVDLPAGVKIDSSKFKNNVGAHQLKFESTNDSKAKAKAIASLVEDDINIPDEKEIVLRGAHYNNLAHKAKDKAIVDDITTATAWHRVTGTPVAPVQYVFNSTSYDITDPIPGNYSVKLSAPGAKDVDRNIILRAGGKPTLTFENDSEIVAVPVLGTQIDVYQDVLGKDDEDTPNDDDKYDNGVANTPLASREKALVYATGNVDTNTQGVYKVTYDVTDLDHNKADQITRIYVVGDATYNEKYALFASDFQEKVDTMQDDDDYIKEMAGPGARDVYGVRFSDLAEVEAIVSFDGADTYKLEARKPDRDDRIAGLHKIEFVIPEDTTPEKLKKTINANTTKHIPPKEPKPEYYIDAKNRTIHVSKVGNQTPEQLTDMQAWDTETGAKPTVKMKSTPEFKAEVAKYTIKYDVVVSGVSKATHTVIIDVIEGEDPEIEVDPDVKEIKLGADSSTINFYEDVKAWDEEDTPGVDEVYPTGRVNEENKQRGILYADGNINTNVQGTYIYTYSVTDLDGNYVDAKRSYVVDGKVGSEYALFANNFDINIKDVAEAAGVETQLKLKTDAHSHKYADPTIEGDTYLDNDGGYKAEAGPYDVTYKVTEDPSLSKTIVASVHDGQVGSKDIMHAINGSIRPSQITTNTVETLTESKAWDKNTKATVGYTYEVFDKDDNLVVFESPQPTGEYKVIFTTDYGTVLERTITVIPGDAPEITDDTPVVEVKKGATGLDLYENIEATDTEDTPNPGDKYPTGAVNEENKVAGKLYADGAVDTSQSGLYVVNYTVTDSDGNTTPAQRSYVVDGDAGLTHAIFADNFDIKVGDVAATPEARKSQLFTRTNARTYALLDPVNKKTTLLNNDGGYKAEAGPYKVVFEAEDEPGLTKQIIASVHDGNVGTDDVMHAIDGSVRPDQIDSNTVKKVTKSKAWDLETGAAVDYGYIVKNDQGVTVDFTVAQPYGEYTVYFETTDKGTKLERTITVVPGMPPVLEVIPAVVEITLGDETPIDVYKGVSGTDHEDTPGNAKYPNGAVNEKEADKQKAVVYANGTIDPSQAGTYIITYDVTDLDGNKVTAQRSYVVDGKVGSEYALFAHDFDILIDDVATTTPEAIKQQLFTKTGATSHKIKEPQTEGTTQLINDGGYKAIAGPYHVTFDVQQEPGLEKSIVASVHNGQVGDEDIMHAINGKVRPGQINATTVETVTESKAWNKTDGTDVRYGYEVKNAKGEIVDFTTAQPIGLYTVTFTTENGTVLVRTIDVIPGEAPEIELLPEIVELNLNAENVDVYEGVTGTDEEDTPPNTEYPHGALDVAEDDRVYEVVYAEGEVDTSEPGVYLINYIVTDSDGNTTKVTRSYIVEGKKGVDYAIFAKNFDILIDQVAETPEAIEEQLFERTGAKSQKLTDPTAVVKTLLTGNGGYKAEAGAYKVDFAVEDEPTLEKQIIASVHNGKVGDEDIMHAINAEVRPNEIVPGIVEQITESKAWDKNTGDPVGYTYEVKDKDDNVVDFTSPQPVGNYKVTFTTVNGTVLERTITVILGNAPELEVEPKVIELSIGDVVPDFYDGVSGTDKEDAPSPSEYPKGNINEETKVPGFVYADGTVDTSQSGTYVVTYQVTDLDGNYVDATRSYVVDGKVGAHYALFADSFEIATSDVAKTSVDRKNQLFEHTHARSELIVDPTQKGKTNLTEDSDYSAVAGGYPITFNVEEEPTVEKTVMANVHDGIIGIQDVMHAVDATIRPSQIKPGIVEEVTQSKAWDKTTGLAVDYDYEVKNDAGEVVDFTTPQPLGSYKVTFTTENGTVLERTITVISGEAPKLFVDPEVVELSVGAPTPDLLKGIFATDLEDTNNQAYTDDRIVPTGTVDMEKAGEYLITYTVTDNDGNSATATRTYKIIMSEKASFSISAENVTLKLDVFEKAKRDGTLDELLLKESKARAQRDNDNKEVSPIQVDTKKLDNVKVVGTTKTVLTHEITKDEMAPYEELNTENGQTEKSETRSDEIVGTVKKEIEIILVDKSKPTLPITGEKTKELMVAGTSLMTLSLLIFYLRRKTNK